jgi:hypothetical protein
MPLSGRVNYQPGIHADREQLVEGELATLVISNDVGCDKSSTTILWLNTSAAAEPMS